MRAVAEPEDFLYFFETIQRLRSLWPDVDVGSFNVSTMTVLGKTEQEIVLDALGKAEDDEDLRPFLDTGTLHADCPRSQLFIRWRKRGNRKVGEFRNQRTLAYKGWSSRSIKVFSKGGLHMTGCKNLEEFRSVTRVIGGLLFATGAMDERLQLTGPEVVMLNFNFSLNCELSLRAVAEAFLDKLGVVSTHETESHPALMVTLELVDAERTRLMIFRSGGVIIATRSQLPGILSAFRLICQLLQDNLQALKAQVSLPHSHKKTQPMVLDGYRSGEALPCYNKCSRLH